MNDGEDGKKAPRGQVPMPEPSDIPPERQGGPGTPGCGSKRGPTASQNEAHKGDETAGKTADRPRRDGGRIKQGDERCGRRWVFSQAHNKTGSIKQVQISHRRAEMGGGNGG